MPPPHQSSHGTHTILTLPWVRPEPLRCYPSRLSRTQTHRSHAQPRGLRAGAHFFRSPLQVACLLPAKTGLGRHTFTQGWPGGLPRHNRPTERRGAAVSAGHVTSPHPPENGEGFCTQESPPPPSLPSSGQGDILPFFWLYT